ncbi:hypothetical protein QMK19_18110 [Streptomyces sp. H10-C2]|uniref:hypothetical protein n=1 Tax=unclassified Streptomyces TaxID=2593676 RepID=UPI0024BB15FE|nr:MULTISPECIES: hypothetical protein [unclassified Streptomyces]MDJ0343467.1 hypothetical protein [Streptomyces sp. PH10-H1]MDJ0371547.1 hypothetical protein [Streptomyces sp. H10-C2]
MTINDLPAAEDGPATSPDESITTPPDESITTPPDDVAPRVSISLPSGPVAAGVPATITVFADPGTRWVLRGGGWKPVPAVTYSETILDVQSVTSIRDHRGGGGSYSVTFPSPGNYAISASAVTTGGTSVPAGPRTVSVVPADPPAFTWVTPADGAVVDLGPDCARVLASRMVSFLAGGLL